MTDSPPSAARPTGPAPESMRDFEYLKGLLREMFQLDRGDLDFGLYRIMNMKAGEIERFLDQDLLPQVKTVLAGVSDEQRAALEAELERAIRSARELGFDPETAPAVAKLREQLAEAKADTTAEAEVYGHLANFFERYYSEGDFMSLRRYSSGDKPTYLIPWDGEEVTLHWANADQYYIKTTENYASYAFLVGEGDSRFRVRFEIAAADNEKDNIKAANGRQRRFVLAEDAVVLDGDDIVVRFEHRPLTEREKRDWPGNGARQQDKIDADTAANVLAAAQRLAPERWQVLAAPAPTDADPHRTLLAKHIGRYTAKNSFDYFIHKDLGGFLRRELDLYLKTDVLDLQDLALGDSGRLRRALARMRAVREIGDKLIAFLAQLEDFQKRLWLKKKFVLETHWCVTLDRVPEALYPEIAANGAQAAEWRALFAIDDIAADPGGGEAAPFRLRPSGFADAGAACAASAAMAEPGRPPLSSGFLEANRNLVLDTRHFGGEFKDRLLVALSEAGSLEEQTDGILIHGENFQAVNLLQARYREQVKCIYIDPPFNTDASPIIYKNGYKSSTWNSLIDNGLRASKSLLEYDGILVAAIDDEQYRELNFIISNIYDHQILGSFVVRVNPSGRPTQSGYSVAHEYLLYAGRGEESAIGRMPPTKEQAARFSQKDEKGAFEWRNLRREGSNSDRSARPHLYYPIYIKGDDIRVPQMIWDDVAKIWTVNENPKLGEFAVFPDNEHGVQKTWRWKVKTVNDHMDDLAVRKDRSGRDYIYYKRRLHSHGVVSMSFWSDGKYSSTEHGTGLLKEMFDNTIFSYPKSIYSVTDSIWIAGASNQNIHVLDYFAGSGTTGHAVIDLNREDGGKRKYILVEMGDHFDTVMLPRLKKIVYAPDWKGGRPAARDKGIAQLIKYVRLESYEDTLDGLVMTPPDDLLAANDPALAEDYRLRYALGEETAESPCLLGRHFRDPFSYTLSTVRDGVRCETPVDLPETFNLLLGLRVHSRRRLDGVLAIAGRNPQGRNCLVLWRNLDETGDDALNRWFRRNRKVLPDVLDIVYANGDHTLNAVRQKNDTWKAVAIEPLFRELMFEADER